MEPKQEDVTICGMDSLCKTLIPLLSNGAAKEIESGKVRAEDLSRTFEPDPRSFAVFIEGGGPAKEKSPLKSIVEIGKSVVFSGVVTDDAIRGLFEKYRDCKSVKVDMGGSSYYYFIRSMNQVIKTWRIDTNPLPQSHFAPSGPIQEEETALRGSGSCHTSSSSSSSSLSSSSGATKVYFQPPPYQFPDSPVTSYPSPPFKFVGEKRPYSPPPLPESFSPSSYSDYSRSHSSYRPSSSSYSSYRSPTAYIEGYGGGKESRQYKKPICPYGKNCYRKNPEHFKKYSHPHMKSSGYQKEYKRREKEEDGGCLLC